MPSTSTSAYPVEHGRSHPSTIAFDELEYPYATRVTRREWQMLLDSWERLQPIADQLATVFFDTLFSCDPELRYLFGGASLEIQFIKFAHLLTELVSLKDDRQELERRNDTIVRRYSSDSSADHVRAIRTAIAAILAQASVARLTPEMRLSWKAAHVTVVTIIRVGARFSPRRGRPTTLMRTTRIASR